MKNQKLILLPLAIVLLVSLAVVVSASSVTVSTFYDSTTEKTATIMQGDSIGVIVSADSIFENSMNVKLDFVDGSQVTNLLNVDTTRDSYSKYYVVGPSVYSDAGVYTLRATVKASSGQTDTAILTLVVKEKTPENNVPVITSQPLTELDEGANYVYDVEAVDGDNDVLTYSLTQKPDWLSINSQTGLITGTAPQVDAEYEFIATVQVSDGKDFDTQTFTITVKDTNVTPPPTNNLPFITSTPVTQVDEDANYAYDVNANDADGDVLVYSLPGAPNWLSINSQTGLISGTAPFVSSDQQFSILVSVSDGKGSVSQSYTLTVKNVPIVPPVNNLPVITSSPLTEVDESQNYVYDVNAVDSDGDVLVYSLPGAPSWLSINSQSGLVTGTAPEVGADVSFFVEVSVSDGEGSAVQNYVLTVKNVPFQPVNHPPVITSTPVTQVNECGSYVYDVEATDGDGDLVSYSLTQKPIWLSINSQTGLITGTAPSVSSDTQIAVTVSVSDVKGATVVQSYTLTVKNVACQTPNSLPVITSSPVTQINEGANYVYDVNAVDSDGDVLTYVLTQKPSWLSINSQTGLITGTAPSVSSDSQFSVSVLVSDGKGSTSQAYTLTVKNSGSSGGGSGRSGGVGTVRQLPTDDFYTAKYLSQFNSPIVIGEDSDKETPTKTRLTLSGKILLWLFILVIILVILIVILWIRRM